MVWHNKPFEEVLSHFESSAQTGLTSKQINGLREKYGTNSLLTQKPKSPWLLLFEQFNNPVIYILVVAAIITSIVGHPKDSIVIAFVVVLNTLIGFVQERRAADALKALRKMAAPTARVIRDGTQQQIPTSEVVCGDVIVLESGMSSPADGRLIDVQNLLVDESMLTGESYSVNKKTNEELSDDVPLGDRLTMIYSGTIIQKGRGLAVVTDVGVNTEFGKISQKVAEAEETVSPLQLQIEKFSKGLSIGIVSIIVLIFIIGFIRGHHWVSMLLTSVGLAVSAIPEGLPVSVTITLSIGIYLMAKNKAIVKRLAAVETLGSTNVICTDKTGTLTKNEMTVARYYTGGEFFEVTGSGYHREGIVISMQTGMPVFANESEALKLAGFVSALCTESTISKEDESHWKITGDPTECALMIAAEKMKFDKNSWAVNIDIPFESEQQLMAVKAKKGDKSYILVKGAPEKILARCKTMINKNGDEIPLDAETLEEIIKKFSKSGLRVLALSYRQKIYDRPVNFNALKDLIFVGFAAIEDSVREEAMHAVGECHSAGVRVVMITGDHIQTAKAVAKSVGIASHKDEPYAITGRDLDKLSDKEFSEKAEDIDVYARVSPHHKFRIVKQLQLLGDTVAMTGDGVNDAPALKQADIGVAMGSGTDVAKEAAHMVLMDDNFATIVKAVRRGRVILHNLQHIILYILATSFGGILTIAVSVLAGFPLPVLPAQLLWINLVTDGTSTFPLGFEPEHGDVMVFPPSRKRTNLIPRKMLIRIFGAGIIMMFGTLGAFYYSLPDIFNASPEELAKARTIAFCTLAFFQIWNVMNSRSLSRSLLFKLPHPKVFEMPPERKHEMLQPIGMFTNKILLGIIILNIFLQVSAVAVPFMRKIFDTVWLGWQEWLFVFSISFSIIIFVEIAKYVDALIYYEKEKKRIAL